MVLRTAKSENWEKDKRQQEKTDSEADALAKVFGDVDVQNDDDDEIDKGDEHQKQPPARAARDLAQHIKVVDWNEDGPAGLARLAEHFPHSCDHQEDDRAVDDPEDGTRSGWLRSLLREDWLTQKQSEQ